MKKILIAAMSLLALASCDTHLQAGFIFAKLDMGNNVCQYQYNKQHVHAHAGSVVYIGRCDEYYVGQNIYELGRVHK